VAARPEQVLHLLTALPPVILRARHLEATNRLRIVGTSNLIEAAVAAGARRIVEESFAGVYDKARFDHPATEDEPLPPVERGVLRQTVAALRTMEEQLRAARDEGRIDTVALRLGFLYGPDGNPVHLLHGRRPDHRHPGGPQSREARLAGGAHGAGSGGGGRVVKKVRRPAAA